MQIDKFIVSPRIPTSHVLIGNLQKAKNNTQVNGDLASEWMIGEGGIRVDQLALVSLRRVSVGCWVPFIRLIDDLKLVPSHELSLVGVSSADAFL